ncbi:MAG: Gfo/Idh/MocA family oxidoreductase [Desulfuromonadales bacterium]
MYNVKILGAGSIGNHLAHASRRMGWDVTMCDLDPAALQRTKKEIFPARYGQWDESIRLCTNEEAPRDGFDLIFIGTPPDSHMDLAIRAIAEKPQAVLVEKPLCTPELERADELLKLAHQTGVQVFVGYNHVVSMVAEKAVELIPQIGPTETLDVEFREHWGGIFTAHPWLDGPQDTYLGFWQKGGGASGEHSHAINLWQHLAHSLKTGRVTEVSASLEYIKTATVDYDKLCLLNLKTENGLFGRVVQDVVTKPARKWGRIQGKDGYIDLTIGAEDRLVWQSGKGQQEEVVFKKTRPDDFIAELKHLQTALEGGAKESPLGLECGLDTMLVVAAAHLANRHGQKVLIDYNKGYSLNALTLDSSR